MKPQHRIRVTLLAENTAQGEGIIGEHGLAVWIEIGRSRFCTPSLQ